jgi:hypothetical protein
VVAKETRDERLEAGKTPRLRIRLLAFGLEIETGEEVTPDNQIF